MTAPMALTVPVSVYVSEPTLTYVTTLMAVVSVSLDGRGTTAQWTLMSVSGNRLFTNQSSILQDLKLLTILVHVVSAGFP